MMPHEAAYESPGGKAADICLDPHSWPNGRNTGRLQLAIHVYSTYPAAARLAEHEMPLLRREHGNLNP
jgi:hypothetical protein